MSKRNMFKRAASTVKYGTLGALGGALTTTVVISLLGLGVHGIKYLGDERLDSDYSLKNRFETAFCFDTPKEHKYYYSSKIVNGYEQDCELERYAASPYLTYGAITAGGIAGAIALGGAGLVLAKRRENER